MTIKNSALVWLTSFDRESYDKRKHSVQLTLAEEEEMVLIHFLLSQINATHLLNRELTLKKLSEDSLIGKYIQITQGHFCTDADTSKMIQLNSLKENVEENFFSIFNSILLISDRDEKISLLVGLLMYLVRNYFLTYASLVAIELTRLNAKAIVENYYDFLALHQREDGSFGLLNPLKPNPFRSVDQYNEWLYLNTLYAYLFLEYRDKESIV